MTGMPSLGFDLKAKLKQILGNPKAPSAEVEETQRRTVCPDHSRRTLKNQRKAEKKNRTRTTAKGISAQASPRRQGGAKQSPMTYKLQPKSIISDLPYQPSNVTPAGVLDSVRTAKGNGLGNKGLSYYEYNYCQAPKAKHVTQGEYPPRQNYVHPEVPTAYTLPEERAAEKVAIQGKIEAAKVEHDIRVLNNQPTPMSYGITKLRKKTKAPVAEKVPVLTKKQRKKAASLKAAAARKAKSVKRHVKVVPKGIVVDDPFKLKHLALEREAELKQRQLDKLKRRERAADHHDELAQARLAETVRRKVKRKWIAEAIKAEYNKPGPKQTSKVTVLANARKRYRAEVELREVA